MSGIAGAGGLALLEGPAGIGKTRLLETIKEVARSRGMRVLAARGLELERGVPFGVVRQLLDREVRSGAPLEGAATVAGQVFNPEPAGFQAPTSPEAVLYGLYWLVSDLAEQQPLLLAVDDAQWADEASLRLLEYLAGRLEGLPLTLFIATRSDDLGEREHIERLAASPQAVRVAPGPLSLDAVGELVRSLLGPAPAAFVKACHDSAGGNPFYVTELLRDLAAERIAPSVETAAVVRELGPRAIARSVLTRLAALRQEAPQLARAVAVLGDEVPLKRAATLGGIDLSAARGAADSLIAAGVFADSKLLSFTHPIVRQAVYREMPRGERGELHAVAARLLEKEDAPLDSIAAQLLLGEPRGDESAAATLRAAGRQALLRGAPETAVRYLLRALEEPPAADDRPRLLGDLGAALARSGNPAAVEVLEEALAVARKPTRRALTAVALGRVLALLDRSADAVAHLLRISDELLDAAPEMAHLLEGEALTIGCFSYGARDTVLPRLREASPPDGQLGAAERELLAALAAERLLRGGQKREAVDLAHHALGAGELLATLSAESQAFWLAVGVLALADEYDAAEAAISPALEEGRRHGSFSVLGLGWSFRALARVRRGNLAGAEADAALATDLPEGHLLRIMRPLAHAVLAEVALERGNHGRAVEILAAAQAGTDDSLFYDFLLHAGARLALARGAPGEALELAQRLRDRQRHWGTEGPAMLGWREPAALATLRLGSPDEAGELAAEELRLARELGAPARALGIALRVAGVVGSGGMPLLEESCRVLARSGARLEHARSLVNLGAALRRANRRSDARAPLREGVALAERCGAAELVRQGREELVSAGARPRARMATGVESLTPSERRVCELAASGSSNRQIAQELFVTVKNVETHLSNAYRKLDISSRTQLAAALERDTERNGSATAPA